MSNELTPKQRIDELLEQAQQALWEAETIADKHNLTFSFEITYGAGATYYPPSEVDEWMRDDLGLEEGQGAWLSSSQQC